MYHLNTDKHMIKTGSVHFMFTRAIKIDSRHFGRKKKQTSNGQVLIEERAQIFVCIAILNHQLM